MDMHCAYTLSIIKPGEIEMGGAGKEKTEAISIAQW